MHLFEGQEVLLRIVEYVARDHNRCPTKRKDTHLCISIYIINAASNEVLPTIRLLTFSNRKRTIKNRLILEAAYLRYI